MRQFRLALLVLSVCASSMLLLATAAGAARGGFVYTESDSPSANGNSILRYTYTSAGKLERRSLVKYRAGGAGLPVVGGGKSFGVFDADQQVIVNPRHTLLFAVNQGSNTIAVFHLASDGSLKPVKGSPFPSGGENPASLGLVGNFLEVVNKSHRPNGSTSTAPNLTTFRVGRGGRLIAVPNSTRRLPSGSSPEQALISPNGKFVFGADFLAKRIRSYRIGRRGRLTQAAGSPQMLNPAAYQGASAPMGVPGGLLNIVLGMAVHPKRPYVYINAAIASRLAVYRYDAHGGLHYVTAVDNPRTGTPCWNVMTSNGRSLYTANTASSDISVYNTSNPASPRRIQVARIHGGGGPSEIGIDPTQRFLFAVVLASDPDSPTGMPIIKHSELHAFRIGRGGKLKEVLSPVALPVRKGIRPQGVAVLPSS